MCYRKTTVIAAMTLLISVANLGDLFAAHGGMGGGFGGGMGGFHGAMGGGFHSGMSGGFHSFAMPSFNGGARNFSYSTQHFSAAPRINGNFVSRIPSNSFNSGFRANNSVFKTTGIFSPLSGIR